MRGGGMMGSGAYGQGMMGGGMMGSGAYGQGMMGGMMGGTSLYGVEPLTLEQPQGALGDYLATRGDENLQLGEIMIFDNHAYAEIVEADSGVGAMELLVDPVTLSVYPEQAMEAAQRYLDLYLPGSVASDEVDPFYGYYTLHIQRDGVTVGMLSVN